MKLDNFEKLRMLGEGTYGRCYLVSHRPDNDLCVLKQVQVVGMSEQDLACTVREATILQALNHPNIIRFLGSFQESGFLNILMEYSDGGDLTQKIKNAKGNYIPQGEILDIFTQMCLAIKHVHDRKIIHRDIKAQNIFLTQGGGVRLGDFGIARHLQLTLQKIKSVVGTPYYMSPEICENKDYSFKSDIWSLGVILLEMCLLKPPFDANSLTSLALKISKGDYLPPPKHYSIDLRRLAGDIMQIDPNKRPSITEILKYPIVKSRIDHFLPKTVKERQFSHTTLHSHNIFEQRLHFKSDQNTEVVVSPRNCISQVAAVISPSKNADLPISKSKESNPFDKKGKKQVYRRQISEPSLTPKGHVKIDNREKILNKNNSLALLKKNDKKESGFKRKSKPVVQIFNGLEEVFEMKNDIKNLCEIASHCASQPRQAIPEQRFESEDDGETLEDTLEALLLNKMSEKQLNEAYRICEENDGLPSQNSQFPGLISLLYGLRTEIV